MTLGELVKRLRAYEESGDYVEDELLSTAADAIEKLGPYAAAALDVEDRMMHRILYGGPRGLPRGYDTVNSGYDK